MRKSFVIVLVVFMVIMVTGYFVVQYTKSHYYKQGYEQAKGEIYTEVGQYADTNSKNCLANLDDPALALKYIHYANAGREIQTLIKK